MSTIINDIPSWFFESESYCLMCDNFNNNDDFLCKECYDDFITEFGVFNDNNNNSSNTTEIVDIFSRGDIGDPMDIG
jgi:hypothetical protein